METGVVNFYDGSKKFGFIRPESGGKIFFHLNDGRRAVPGEGQPKFYGTVDREPKTGDRLAFTRKSSGHKGPKAAPWVFEEEWTEMEVVSRSVYRVLESTAGWGLVTKENAKVLWQGSDLYDLCKKYPLPSMVPSEKRYRNCDKLIRYWSHDDGFEIRHWFERQASAGNWEDCEDPRCFLEPALEM